MQSLRWLIEKLPKNNLSFPVAFSGYRVPLFFFLIFLGQEPIYHLLHFTIYLLFISQFLSFFSSWSVALIRTLPMTQFTDRPNTTNGATICRHW